MSSRRFGARAAAVPFLVLTALSLLLWGALWSIDHGALPPAPWVVWGDPGAADAMLGFAEVTVGVLAITITVVAIVVELAATRYTPRITELFVRDPVNVSVMGLFVVTSVVVTWSELSLHEEPYPRALAVGAVALMTASQLALLPYFAYVFDFLSPTGVIERIRAQGTRQLRGLSAGVRPVPAARGDVVRAVEQLGDIASNSIEKKDKVLVLAALQALEQVALDGLARKDGLPVAWFDTAPLVRVDQDFVALHPDLVRALTERRTWLEMKVLRQYQEVFGEALHRMRDVNHLIAIHTRRVAIAAMQHGDEAACTLVMRFLNTYLRTAINARDVRTVYNLFNEYRLLGERAQELGRREVVLEVARFLKVYGQIAFSADLPFLLETAAYDLGRLVEVAHERGDPSHDALLGWFLQLDREAEGRSQEASLRGVRKAQIKLGTWYLTRGDTASADKIALDLRDEDPARLAALRVELEQVTEAEYWEVSDRGVNFEWLPEAQRDALRDLFERVG
ncbi:MAG: DUF2254 family protein [Myxococcota bacterium]